MSTSYNLNLLILRNKIPSPRTSSLRDSTVLIAEVNSEGSDKPKQMFCLARALSVPTHKAGTKVNSQASM